MLKKKYILINGLISLMMMIALYIVSKELPSVLLFIPGVAVAFIVCIKLSDKITDKSKSVLSWYLIALAIQFLHFAEEYLTGFVSKLPAIIGQEPYPLDYWVTFNMVAYSIFILGAIALHKNTRSYFIIPVFFIVVGVILNGVAHVLLSFYTGGYFPGLFTAIIYIILIPFIIRSGFKMSTV